MRGSALPTRGQNTPRSSPDIDLQDSEGAGCNVFDRSEEERKGHGGCWRGEGEAYGSRRLIDNVATEEIGSWPVMYVMLSSQLSMN